MWMKNHELALSLNCEDVALYSNRSYRVSNLERLPDEQFRMRRVSHEAFQS